MKIPGKGVTAKTICKTYGDYNTINPLVTIRFSFAYDSDFLPEICNATHLPKYIEKGEKTSCITITGVIGHWNRLLDICDDTLKKKIEDCILVKGTKHSFHVPGLREEEIAQYDGKLFGATSTSVFFDLVYYGIHRKRLPEDKISSVCVGDFIKSQSNSFSHIARYVPYPPPNLLCLYNDCDLDNGFGWQSFDSFIRASDEIKSLEKQEEN